MGTKAKPCRGIRGCTVGKIIFECRTLLRERSEREKDAKGRRGRTMCATRLALFCKGIVSLRSRGSALVRRGTSHMRVEITKESLMRTFATVLPHAVAALSKMASHTHKSNLE